MMAWKLAGTTQFTDYQMIGYSFRRFLHEMLIQKLYDSIYMTIKSSKLYPVNFLLESL